jgi:O-antigen biosynthesis protein WbqV
MKDVLKRPHAVLAHDLDQFYRGKCVAITGAAGSIGSALAEDLAKFECGRLVLLDHFDHGLLDIIERVGRIDRRRFATFVTATAFRGGSRGRARTS